jgi:hypothetical protein
MIDPGAEERRRAIRAARRERRRRQVRRRRLAAAVALFAGLAAATVALAGGDAAPGERRAGDASVRSQQLGGSGRTEGAGDGKRNGGGTSRNVERPARGVVEVAAVGDTMLGMTPTLPPSPERYFAGVGRWLDAEVSFVNLEGTFTNATASKCAAIASGCFAFRAPPEYAPYLRDAGFDVVSNANNHAFDFWQAGLDETMAALDSAGLAHTGRPDEIATVRAGKLRVAVVAFASYSNTAPLNDLAAAAALVERAARRAHVVIAAMHAGAEGSSALHVTGETEVYAGENRGNPRAFAHAMIDAGADLVLGSGPHVLRGMEVYRGRLAAYSLGDFAGYRNFSIDGMLGVSCILRVKLAADGRLLGGRVVPVRLVDEGRPVLDASGEAIRLVSQLSRDDFGAAAAPISADGRIEPGR